MQRPPYPEQTSIALLLWRSGRGTDVEASIDKQYPLKKEMFMKHDQDNTPLSKKVGEKIEKAGQKISNAGATKVGSFISRMGDKLEHAGDHKHDANAPNKNRK